jgi:ATP-dependent DNA helicase RecG
MIHHKIGEKISPSIDYDIDTIQVPGTIPARYVISVSVKVSRNLPVVIHEGGLLGIYVRNYGQTQIATPEQIRDLVLMSDHVPYDSPFTELSYDKKDFSILFKLAGEREADITDKQLISIGFMSEERKLSKGALLFRDDCNDLRTETVCSVWPELSKESSIVLAHQEYAGNLLEIISKSIQFVKNHSANGYRKELRSKLMFFVIALKLLRQGLCSG